MVPLRRYVTAFLFVIMQVIIFYYWRSFPLANTIFTDGIPQLGSSAEYLSARYGWDWWHLWLLSLNQLLPMVLAWSLVHPGLEEYTRMHRWFSTTAIRINLWVFAVLTVRWWLFCNTPFSDGASACNAYDYCCVFFPSPWCPNSMPCIPNKSFGDLGRNNEMTQHWAFSLVFFLMSLWSVSINADLRDFGVLK